ncbi:type II secretion system protein J [Euzebya sp.]|uniref:PulJ/GspJ family protein n=1 Tax=Euzebya sp. TaxID=1971409 RepID=UPI003515C0AC
MRRLARDEGGFTLTELLVSISLMALVSSAIIASTVAVQRNLGAANATMNDLRTARLAVDRVGSLLRGAVSIDGTLSDATEAITAGTASSVTFYSSTDRAADLDTNTVYNPVRVQIVVEQQPDDGQWDLIERIWYPTAATDRVDQGTPVYPSMSSPTQQRTIVRDLASTDVFTYWTHYGDDLDAGGGESNAASRCGVRLTPALDAAERRAVDSVSFRLVIQEPTGYESSPADLQGWARFASARDVGFSPTLDSAGCVEINGFAYEEAYEVSP